MYKLNSKLSASEDSPAKFTALESDALPEVQNIAGDTMTHAGDRHRVELIFRSLDTAGRGALEKVRSPRNSITEDSNSRCASLNCKLQG